MKVFILSDIHGNLEALNICIDYINQVECNGIIILGDIVDYGPHSNEVIEVLSRISIPIFCNILGNHEDAMFHNQYHRFSTDRGVDSAKHTKSLLTEFSIKYLTEIMDQTGKKIFSLGNKTCLAVHGNIEDEYWGKFALDSDLANYENFDYVFTGHSHKPHFFESFSKVDNPAKRNTKKTIFINPGSVGQPRNLCNLTQFAFLDTETEQVEFIKLKYDITKEQKCFSDNVDEFYKKRLEVGV